MNDELKYCKKHHHSYVSECIDCYREQSACIHGVPFDSECGECEEDAKIVKDGKERSCKEKIDNLKIQIGGNHYTKLKIQPMTYSMENGLDPLQHTIIKYVTRFRDKNGVEDLEKAKHCIDMLIDWELNNG